eukprot:2640964-Karenia_brevis.AAC.1
MDTRKATGWTRLITVAGETKACVRPQVYQHIQPGSVIFTDRHKAYQWLSDEGFVHRAVNHKQREFSREERIYGVPVV